MDRYENRRIDKQLSGWKEGKKGGREGGRKDRWIGINIGRWING